jgi:hypothetical protein
MMVDAIRKAIRKEKKESAPKTDGSHGGGEGRLRARAEALERMSGGEKERRAEQAQLMEQEGGKGGGTPRRRMAEARETA